jgi:hypothetical protein
MRSTAAAIKAKLASLLAFAGMGGTAPGSPEYAQAEARAKINPFGGRHGKRSYKSPACNQRQRRKLARQTGRYQ